METPGAIFSCSETINLERQEEAKKEYKSLHYSLYRCLELLSMPALAPLFTYTIRPISFNHGPTSLFTAFLYGDNRMGAHP